MADFTLDEIADGLWLLKWYDDCWDGTEEPMVKMKEQLKKLEGRDRDYVFARLEDMNRAARERPAWMH
jgi:hypothetical protein